MLLGGPEIQRGPVAVDDALVDATRHDGDAQDGEEGARRQRAADQRNSSSRAKCALHRRW